MPFILCQLTAAATEQDEEMREAWLVLWTDANLLDSNAGNTKITRDLTDFHQKHTYVAEFKTLKNKQNILTYHQNMHPNGPC